MQSQARHHRRRSDSAHPEVWHETRRQVIGGSDVADVLGVGYVGVDGPPKVYASKVHGWRQPGTEAMARGHRLEPLVVAEFCHRTGYVCAESEEHLRHPSFPDVPLGGNVDRDIIGRRLDLLTEEQRGWVVEERDGVGLFARCYWGALECKTTRHNSTPWFTYNSGRIYPPHLLQVHVYAACAGHRWGYLACGSVFGDDAAGLHDFAVIAYMPSRRLITAIKEVAAEWWATYIATETPPPAERHPRATEIMQLVSAAKVAPYSETPTTPARPGDTMTHQTTAIATVPAQQPGAIARPTIDLQGIIEIAGHLARAGMWTDRRDSDDVAQSKIVAKILYGAELGLSPVASLQAVQVIQGRPTLGARGIGATIKQSGKYDYRIIESSNDRCEVVFFELGEEVGRTEWTMEDAKRAGLGGDNWRKYPRAMLSARAISEGARIYCPDIFGGPVYTPEEMTAVYDSRPPLNSEHPEWGPADGGYGSDYIEAEPVEDSAELRNLHANRERHAEKRNLFGVIKSASLDPAHEARLIRAVKTKAAEKCGTEDADEWPLPLFAELAGTVRAHIDGGTVHGWCDHILGDAGAATDETGEASAEPPPGDKPAKSEWDKANAAFHAELATAVREARLDDTQRDVIRGLVRADSGLAPSDPWSRVSLEVLTHKRQWLREISPRDLHELTDTGGPLRLAFDAWRAAAEVDADAAESAGSTADAA